MKREIKFRAWNKIDHLLCDVVEIVFGADDSYVAVENGQYIERWRFDDIEILQYTGLKDDFDVEVYEGDIVTFYEYGNLAVEVIYSDGKFAVTLSPEAESFPSLSDYNVKVIGNKFENPELLEAD